MTTKKESLQEQIKTLDELVRYFENGNQGFELDSALEKYEQAMQIVKDVKGELESYELKIKEIEAKYNTEETPSQDSLLA